MDREEIKERIKEAADIVEVVGEHVRLRRAGRNFVGLCPFHADKKSPSLSVNQEGQFYHCFGCGESGDVFSFLMKYHNMDFPEALKTLAARYNIPLPERRRTPEEERRRQLKNRLLEINERAARIFESCLEGTAGRAARDYLAARGISLEAARPYRLGYSPPPEAGGWDFLLRRMRQEGISGEELEQAGLAVQGKKGVYDRFRGRILFPIIDLKGQVAAFGGRIVGEGEPKYMNSPETPVFSKGSILLGLFQHREAIRKERQVLVVEGNFDLLGLAVHGISHVVAPLGTALTPAQVGLLARHADEAVLLFDGDEAGMRAALRAIPHFLARNLPARVAVPPEGHDPDSLVREQGPDAIRALVETARPLEEFAVEGLLERHGDGLEGKARIVEELRPLIQAAEDPVRRSLLAGYFGERLGVDLSSVASETPRGRGRGRSARQVPEAQSRSPAIPPEDFFPEDISPEQGVLAEGVSEDASFQPPVRPLSRILPQKCLQVVDVLLWFPEHLDELLDAGAGEILSGGPAERLAGILADLEPEARADTARLREALPEGPLRDLVVERLCARAEPCAPEVEEALLAEVLDWLRGQGAARRRQDLLEAIARAEAEGDAAQVSRLLDQFQGLPGPDRDFSDNRLKKIG